MRIKRKIFRMTYFFASEKLFDLIKNLEAFSFVNFTSSSTNEIASLSPEIRVFEPEITDD